MTKATWTPDAGATRAVALEVLINGPISRSEIARRLELSPGSLTRLSTPLLEAGILIEAEERSEGRAGRPSRPLDIVPDSRRFLGAKLAGDRLVVALTDFRASVLASETVPLPDHEVPAVVAAIVDAAARLGAEAPGLTGIGIGVGALVGEGRVLSAPFLGWQDVPLAELVTEATGIPTVVENDLVAFTEYEHWFGAAKACERFAVVTLGAGIGYGLVVHDRIVLDDDSGIGLVGHWPVDPFGPVCVAGHRGCARSVLTTDAVVSAASSALGRELDYDEVMRLAALGDPGARRVVDDAARGLGRLIAAIGNLVMPELVVLGGEGVQLAAIGADAVREGIARDRDPRAAEVRLSLTDGDDTEWCRGAAVIAIQEYVAARSPR
ncbi:MAG: ROK family transcriptional regulator [Microbacteriaceae bacterium]|nr:MAG: ROK family transcriptional regulator [Microbacteriaceae bacterium]